ncbi:HAMP domain-containing protein [Bdellovibrio bacteriovorus]|uniref:HAMP domain-containing protein n=1 Tax=Bdellovibrio bacteriovorus TaxID=959 RepID=UPI0035A6CE02
MKLFKPRRKMIVNQEVQYDVLMYVGLFVVSIFIVQIFTAYLFIEQVEKVVGSMSALEFLSRYKVSFLVYQIIPVSLSLLVGIYIFNRLTSRIAGPLYNIKRVLRRVSDVDADNVEIKLRQDDYFQEEVKDINVILKRKSK